MPEVKATASFVLECRACGRNLERDSDVVYDIYGNATIRVEPCPDCLEEEWKRGYDARMEEEE